MTTKRNNAKHPWRNRVRPGWYTPKVHVACTECGCDYDEDQVTTLNIEENILGEDVLTFRCPEGHETKALRRA